ncbi:MAG TPA: methyltransferase domain-containing protein [Deltaproteobacteria bacterium]|nr:methyltransferase domain-containing protein [Deltaproteobacteria bacterium]
MFISRLSVSPEARLQTQLGSYVFSRQRELILDLVSPNAGERVLDICCGTGNYLKIFKEKWCSVAGIDHRPDNLQIARNKLGEGAELVAGQADDLPFSDNEFDIVTIINALEILPDPSKVIAEAIRVCRQRMFIGFINNFSVAGTKQKLKEIFGFPLNQNMRFFRLNEIKKMVGDSMGIPDIKWGSVIYFPTAFYSFLEEVEELMPLESNPLGAFTGLSFPIKYTYQTVQNPLDSPFKLGRKTKKAAQGAARDMLKETNK